MFENLSVLAPVVMESPNKFAWRTCFDIEQDASDEVKVSFHGSGLVSSAVGTRNSPECNFRSKPSRISTIPPLRSHHFIAFALFPS